MTAIGVALGLLVTPACGARSELEEISTSGERLPDFDFETGVLVYRSADQTQLLSIDLPRGRDAYTLTPADQIAHGFDWSPTADRLAYVSKDDLDRKHLWVRPRFDDHWGEPAVIVVDDVTNMTWDPTGTRLLIEGWGADDRLGIVSVGEFGRTAIEEVVPGPQPGRRTRAVGWSGDGRALAWELLRGNNVVTTIGITRFDSSAGAPDPVVIDLPSGFDEPDYGPDPTALAPLEHDENPISPEGRWVFFSAADTDSGARAAFLVDLTRPESEPARVGIPPVVGGYERIRGAFWSPDLSGRFMLGAKQVVYVCDAATLEVVSLGGTAP
jgi:hypothetical protein